MDWSGVYAAIVERAKRRAKPDERLEIHHILPRSLGGGDNLDNLVTLTIREHYVAHKAYDRAHGTHSLFGRGPMSSRKWLKARTLAYNNQLKPVQDARKFLEGHGDQVLSSDVVTKFLDWGELKNEVERFRALNEVDLDMAKRFEGYFRLMAMEHHCGMSGFGKRNDGKYLTIYQMFGNYA